MEKYQERGPGYHTAASEIAKRIGVSDDYEVKQVLFNHGIVEPVLITMPRTGFVGVMEGADLDHMLGCMGDGTDIDISDRKQARQLIEKVYFCNGTTVSAAMDGRLAIIKVNPELCHRPDIYAGATADPEEKAIDELHGHIPDNNPNISVDEDFIRTERLWILGKKEQW
jgi:hypothetical protein